MKASVSSEALAAFLVAAHRNTYADKGAAKAPSTRLRSLDYSTTVGHNKNRMLSVPSPLKMALCVYHPLLGKGERLNYYEHCLLKLMAKLGPLCNRIAF